MNKDELKIIITKAEEDEIQNGGLFLYFEESGGAEKGQHMDNKEQAIGRLIVRLFNFLFIEREAVKLEEK